MSVLSLYFNVARELENRGIFIDHNDIHVLVKIVIKGIIESLEENSKMILGNRKDIVLDKKGKYYRIKINSSIPIKNKISMMDKDSLKYFNDIFLPLIEEIDMEEN